MNRAAVRQSLLVAAIVAGLVSTAVSALADPPSRVARLNYVKGSVSLRPGTADDWGPASINYPLTTGDHLWTDVESWAEMHVGSTAIRLAPQTAFAFLNLDDRMVQLRVSEGAVDIRVRNLDGGDGFEVSTPSAAVVLSEPGVYRVDVLPGASDTRVTVRQGTAEVFADDASFSVREGQAAAIAGTGYVSQDVFRAGAPDDWERWCRARDEREDGSESLRYVSYEMTGYEDLDEYGTWESVPDYGWAWAPSQVAPGWAPYRHGHWRWVEPWGWTWVDQAAWGFAPFHYGRWACHRGRWLWVPGSYATHPVYAPALVAFIGGSGWGASFGLGYQDTFAWFPLAPGEVWMPHYHASHAYINNLNHTSVRGNIVINNYQVSRGTYVNRAITGAVTAVPRDAFLGGRAVPRHAVAVDRRAAMTGEVVGMSAAVAPRADSVVTRAAGVRRPPAAAMSRAVVARTEPPAAPVPFQARERALQAQAGRPLDDAVVESLRRRGTSDTAGPVRLAGARATRRGDPALVDSAEGQAARPAASETFGGMGTAARGDGRRPRPVEGAGQPGVATGATQAEPRSGAGINDRPGWARPQGSTTGASPGSWSGGQATPRPGERPVPGQVDPQRRGDEGREAPGARRPGGENARPSWGGGEARPSAPSPGARDRSGGERGQPGNDQARPSGSDSSRTAPSGAGVESRPTAPGGARERSGGGGERSQPGAAQSAPRSSGSDKPSGGAGVRGGNGQQSAPPAAAPGSRPPGGARPRGDKQG